MAYIRGEDITVGVGIETTRGTAITPAAFVAARAPTDTTVLTKKVLIKETKGSGIMSTGSDIISRSAAGKLEMNVRSETFGYFLLSLLGKVTTTTVTGSVKKHAFKVLTGNPQFPTLTLGLAVAGSFQDYVYNNVLVNKLELKAPLGDLANAVVDFVANDEATHAAYTPTFTATDYAFRPFNVSVKFAATVSALGAATAVNVKDFAIQINNNAKARLALGTITPLDQLANLIEISGDFEIDYADTTYHDAYQAGTAQAMQIVLSRADIDLGSSNAPSATIIMDKVTFEKYSANRPLDDIASDKVSFQAHYDATNANAIEIDVINTITAYA